MFLHYIDLTAVGISHNCFSISYQYLNILRKLNYIHHNFLLGMHTGHFVQ